MIIVKLIDFFAKIGILVLTFYYIFTFYKKDVDDLKSVKKQLRADFLMVVISSIISICSIILGKLGNLVIYLLLAILFIYYLKKDKKYYNILLLQEKQKKEFIDFLNRIKYRNNIIEGEFREISEDELQSSNK